MTWPAHPDDEWVEITAFGDEAPRYALARSGAATQIADGRARYLADQITVDELEAIVEDALTKGTEAFRMRDHAEDCPAWSGSVCRCRTAEPEPAAEHEPRHRTAPDSR